MSDERVRLFVALELPVQAREALIAWRAAALAGAEGVRLIEESDLHVTLCFLGWRLESEIDPISEACEAVAGRPAPRLALGEAIALPRRRPRVVAVGLEDRGGTLAGLQATLSAALAAGGWYRPEERPFLGHVTVARAGRAARVRRGALADAPPEPLAFRSSRVTLYRSRLYRSGARYEPLSGIELDSGA